MAESAGFLQIPGWSAQTGRLVHVTPFINQSSNTTLTTLQVRSGVLPGPDITTHSFAPATKVGGANMSVDVWPGLAVIQGTEAANQGAYVVWETAKVNKTIAPADPTFSRRDLVILRVQDSAYSTANNLFTVEVVTGSPAAVPVDPGIPVNSFAIARVVVAPATTTITLGTNLFDIRPYTSSRGGSLIVSDVGATGGTETNLKPTVPEPYQIILEKDSVNSIERLKIWIPALSRWDVIGIGVTDALTGTYTPVLGATVTPPTMGTGSFSSGRWARISHDLVYFTASVTFGTSGTAGGSGSYTMSLPFTAATTTVGNQIGLSGWVNQGDPNSFPMVGSIASAGTTALMWLSRQAATNGFGSGFVGAAANEVVTLSGVYRIASA